MAHEAARIGWLACGLALLLGGCAALRPPFASAGVVRPAPRPEAVVSRGNTRNLPPCPPQLIAQTQWLSRNMARLRLGFSKLQVVSVVGDPAHAETFELTNGATLEVLFYHTPETICRVAASAGSAARGLMPMVFQDDRLIGYGPSYYHDFIVPQLRPQAANPMPQTENEAMGVEASRTVSMQPATPLQPAPARTGRWQQEDLPVASSTRTVSKPSPPSGVSGGNGYTGAMQMNDSHTTVQQGMQPVGYVYQTTTRLGRGEPLQ